MKKVEKEKLAKAKARAKQKVQEAAAKKKPRGEVGEFGYPVRGLKHQFCVAISKKPMTMKEVKQAAWNKKNSTFYQCFNELKALGVGVSDAKTKKMSIVKKKK